MANLKEGVQTKSLLNSYAEKRMSENDCFKKAYYEYENKIEIAFLTKQLRNSLNLSKREFAKKVNKPQSTIARIENGTMNPSIELLENIAAATNSKLKIEFVPIG